MQKTELRQYTEGGGALRELCCRMPGGADVMKEDTEMEISGKTRTCGLIGCPVEHTLSPVIHNTLAAQMGHDLVYVPFLVQPGRLREAVQGADALQLSGLNVTVPYKSEVIGCLQEVDALAQTIGAVNTLVRTAGGYKGYNTEIGRAHV